MNQHGVPTRTDAILARLKNNPVVAVIIVAGMGLGGLEATTGLVSCAVTRTCGGGDPGLAAEYCQLLAPLIAQLDRTKLAFDEWTEPSREIERTIKAGNEAALDLLTSQAGLVHSSLRDDAAALIEHYDYWLREYWELREGVQEGESLGYVWVGPDGHGFPRGAERNFTARREEVERELGESPCI